MTPDEHDHDIAPEHPAGWTVTGDPAAIAPAWVAALGELEDVTRGREAVVEMKSGGTYRYRYADLGAVLGQARGVLARHGLAVFQVPRIVDDDVVVTTSVMHTSGSWLTFAPFRLPAGTTAQSTGSAITYARRYCLLSILGLATDDDDGAAAGTRPSSSPAVLLNPATVAGFLERATAAGLDDTAIGDVVDTATGGRTRDPHAVLDVELDALRAALADAADNPAPSPITATRAQLAAVHGAEDRAGLGLDRLAIRAAVLGRTVDDDHLAGAEAERWLAALDRIAAGELAVRWLDDGAAELVAAAEAAP